MEKLIFKNARGKRIELSMTSQFIMRSIDGVSGVELEIEDSKSYRQDGRNYKNNTLGVRYIDVDFTIIASSVGEMALSRKRIIETLNPKLGLGELVYEFGGMEKKIEALPENSPILTRMSGAKDLVQDGMITFYCPDPYFRDLAEVREDISTLKGNFAFPWEIPAEGYEVAIRTISFVTNVYNIGEVEVPIRVSLTATGTVVNPVVTNLATGEYIMVKRELLKGDELEIDTQFGNKRVEIIRSNGDRENVFHYIDYKSTFFSIDSGDTEIEYGAEVGDNNLDVYIYYTPRYLGV